MAGITCPACGGPARVLESRRHYSGQVRRRFCCCSCAHRWTSYGGELPPPPRTRGQSEDAVRDMLTSSESAVVLAHRWGCSRSAVERTRTGDLNARVLPDLPRWNRATSCTQCRHWDGRCDLGFPDPLEEGLTFARECVSFMERKA